MGQDSWSLRWLDAALNRAREALRVLEDRARYLRDDAQALRGLKHLRHEVAGLEERLGVRAGDLLASRDVDADAGRGTSSAEGSGRNPEAANFKRLQEALRSVEEWARQNAPGAAEAVEGMRFRAYGIERTVRLPDARASRLATCRLYWIGDARALGADPVSALRDAARAGVGIFQLREKGLRDAEHLALARRIATACRETGIVFILNDRPDLARASGADGVHLGQDDLPLSEARAIVGEGAILGRSTHDEAQVERAQAEGADYIGCGPVHATPTKAGRAPIGLDLLSRMLKRARLPAFAIGGITPENAGAVVRAGASRVAVVRAIGEARDRAGVIRALRSALDGASRPAGAGPTGPSPAGAGA